MLDARAMFKYRAFEEVWGPLTMQERIDQALGVERKAPQSEDQMIAFMRGIQRSKKD